MITTEGLMIHALKRGILIADFNVLSVGMILDYINQYDHLHMHKDGEEENVLKAGQDEFNGF